MTAVALGVFEDLRTRKLLPVAIALLIGLVAVPLLMLEPAQEAPALAPAATADVSTGGLPGPAEALEGKPLVSLAVLNRPSDLENFDTKNPFKPLEELDMTGTGTDALADGGMGGSDAGTAATGGGSAGGTTDGTDGGTGGGAIPDIPGSTPTPDGTPIPSPDPDPDPAPVVKFTYAVDLTLDGPGPARRYRNLPRLALLPTEEAPLLVFLGVSVSGNEAVFLVDSKLRSAGGGGACTPSPDACATVSIEPGEQHTFLDDQGDSYVLTIDQIREVSLSDSGAPDSGTDVRAGAAVGGPTPVERFVPLLLVDFLTSGGQQ